MCEMNVFKVGLSPSKKICDICFIETPLKMIKKAFYFIFHQLFSFSRYLSFYHDFMVMYKKQLD